MARRRQRTLDQDVEGIAKTLRFEDVLERANHSLGLDRVEEAVLEFESSERRKEAVLDKQKISLEGALEVDQVRAKYDDLGFREVGYKLACEAAIVHTEEEVSREASRAHSSCLPSPSLHLLKRIT